MQWFSFPPPLLQQNRQGSDLVLCEQEVQSWASGHSHALPAGRWLARQVTGMRQGSNQESGQSDWVPDLQNVQILPGMGAAPASVSAAWSQARWLGSELA